MHNVFISYHHRNDQYYKNALLELGRSIGVFIDKSVDTADISERLSDQAIREKIRDEYLRDSTVTVLLAGLETKGRKHIDWELYSSMFDGVRNKKSGILVVTLPATNCTYFTAVHHGEDEKRVIYPEQTPRCQQLPQPLIRLRQWILTKCPGKRGKVTLVSLPGSLTGPSYRLATC